MPFTFLSHQAPVLPLKMARPQWFDGTALVLGSMAPDLALFSYGTGVSVDAHSLAAQFWLCLPLTLVLTWTVKRVMAAPLGPHLPTARSFRLQDYGRLGAWQVPRTRAGWAVLISSALVGSFSHIVVDSFTHDSGWAVENVAALRTLVVVLPPLPSGQKLYAYNLLQAGLTVIGAAIAIWCLRIIGRRRLIATWHPAPNRLEPTSSSRRMIAVCTSAGLVAGLVAAGAVVRDGRHEVIIWFAAFTFFGLLLGCAVARPMMTTAAEQPERPEPPGSPGSPSADPAGPVSRQELGSGP
jgi:hypothetical protein